MAVTARRRLETTTTRRFGSGREAYAIPDLTEIQTEELRAVSTVRHRRTTSARMKAWKAFCAKSSRSRATTRSSRFRTCATNWASRATNRMNAASCGLTYGRPFRIWLRLNKEQPIEEEVYLGDLPIMLGGGEFIINGAERVVVSQLHRSPGIDFVSEMEAGERRLLQLPRDSRARKLDRNQHDEEGQHHRPHRPERQVLGDDAAASDGSASTGSMPISCARSTKPLSRRSPMAAVRPRSKARSRSATSSIRSAAIGPARSSSRAARRLPRRRPNRSADSGLKLVEIMEPPATSVLLNALADDGTSSHEEALLRIYQRLRPGNPPQLEKAKVAVPRKVLRHESLSAGSRRPLPHQPQARSHGAGRRNGAAAGRLDQRGQVFDAACHR